MNCQYVHKVLVEHYNAQKVSRCLGPSKSPMWTILMLLLQRRFSYIGECWLLLCRERRRENMGVSWKFPLYFAYSVLVLFEQYIRRAVLAAAAVPKPPPLVFVFSMVGSCHHKGGGLVGLLVLVLLLLLLSYHKSPRLCWYAAQWIDMQGWWCVVCGTRDGIHITGLSIQNPAYVNMIQGKSVNNKFYTG